LITALMTATYTFRAYFLTFIGEERVPHEAGHHAHESPPNMSVPLVILAVCAAVVGLLALNHTFADFLHRTPSLAYEGLGHADHGEHVAGEHTLVAAISTVVALAGIGLAAFLYLGKQGQVEWLARRLRPLYLLSYGKLFLDELYNVLFIWPIWLLAQLCYIIDRWIVDGIVNLFGTVPQSVGNLLRSLQTGMVQFYALAMVLGLLVLLGTLLIGPK
jgi:NADH:ubiquinone oxidoreductase subunit 5 (subunit L)/multisubunit Na+/H+ antiporter MnhA subunit